MFELIEDLVHSPQEDLPVVREALDQEQCFLYQIHLLCVLAGFLSQQDYPSQDLLGVLLVCNQDQQRHCLVCQRHVRRVQAVHQSQLPPIETLGVGLGQVQ